jgi:HprK-related kinase A
MRRVGQLTSGEFHDRLTGGELALQIGPYVYNIQSDLADVAAGISMLYTDFALADTQGFTDYRVSIRHGSLWRRARGLADFYFDETTPFEAIPAGQAYAFLEWGMNWCVSLHANEYLKLHAGTVSRGDAAIVMPGVPGSGKSTLCAALGLSGWRVLSDEHAMILPDTPRVVPLCRPVSLKNESIDVIRSFSSSAVFGPTSLETHKGRVAHMKADLHPDSHCEKPLTARWMVFPRFSRDDPQRLVRRRRTDSFVLAAFHSFNYSLLGETGFNIMSNLVNSVDCFDLVYHDLDWAVKTMDELLTAEAGL